MNPGWLEPLPGFKISNYRHGMRDAVMCKVVGKFYINFIEQQTMWPHIVVNIRSSSTAAAAAGANAKHETSACFQQNMDTFHR